MAAISSRPSHGRSALRFRLSFGINGPQGRHTANSDLGHRRSRKEWRDAGPGLPTGADLAAAFKGLLWSGGGRAICGGNRVIAEERGGGSFDADSYARARSLWHGPPFGWSLQRNEWQLAAWGNKVSGRCETAFARGVHAHALFRRTVKQPPGLHVVGSLWGTR